MAEFKTTNSGASLSAVLTNTANSLGSEPFTLRELLELVGEQGLLTFCIILNLPFLIPVSIPGVSTIFGTVIILIGIGLTLNRLPWLPERLMQRQFSGEQLAPILVRGSEYTAKLERWIHPRLGMFTDGPLASRINGLAIVLGGILLLFPLGLVPFSNTLPGIAVMLLAIGMLQRDGYFIFAGYLFLVATIIYFAALAWLVIVGGTSLIAMFGSSG